MQILIQSRKKSFVLEVSPSDTVEKVKNKIKEKENIPINHQNLIFKDTILNNDKTLSDYNINNKDVIQLVIRILANMKEKDNEKNKEKEKKN